MENLHFEKKITSVKNWAWGYIAAALFSVYLLLTQIINHTYKIDNAFASLWLLVIVLICLDIIHFFYACIYYPIKYKQIMEQPTEEYADFEFSGVRGSGTMALSFLLFFVLLLTQNNPHWIFLILSWVVFIILHFLLLYKTKTQGLITRKKLTVDLKVLFPEQYEKQEDTYTEECWYSLIKGTSPAEEEKIQADAVRIFVDKTTNNKLHEKLQKEKLVADSVRIKEQLKL